MSFKYSPRQYVLNLKTLQAQFTTIPHKDTPATSNYITPQTQESIMWYKSYI